MNGMDLEASNSSLPPRKHFCRSYVQRREVSADYGGQGREGEEFPESSHGESSFAHIDCKVFWHGGGGVR